MKKAIIIIISALFACNLAFFIPRIQNAKKTGTIGNRTGDYCAWEKQNVTIWPNETLNQIGNCRELTCTENFEIHFTGCAFDMTGHTRWIHQNLSKPFPACCGTQVSV